MPGYESIMICGRAPDGLPRVLSLDNDGHIPGIGAYYSKVLGYGPIAYWPLWDAIPPTAEELVNSPAQDGAHSNVTLGQPGIGDGQTSCLYNGTTSYTNIWTPSFRDAFNGGEGTVMAWGRVFNVGVWTDGVHRRAHYLGVDANNYITQWKHLANTVFGWEYKAGGVSEFRNGAGFVTTNWFHVAITWSAADDEVRAYYNGIQEGVTMTVLGVWAGNLSANSAVIGATSSVPSNVWHGWLAHAVVFDHALSPAAILDLSIV